MSINPIHSIHPIRPRRARNMAGITLIELILFIVIISVGLVGILSVIHLTTRASADPLMRKQALAIAESLLEEVALQPFTYCDPDDANAATATSSAVGATTLTCAAAQPANESRYSSTAPFDNVIDYNGFTMTGDIRDITNASMGLSGYSATIAVTEQGANALPAIPAAAVLLISVTVTGPDNVPITLEGYRTRYAPNALP